MGRRRREKGKYRLNYLNRWVDADKGWLRSVKNLFGAHVVIQFIAVAVFISVHLCLYFGVYQLGKKVADSDCM